MEATDSRQRKPALGDCRVIRSFNLDPRKPHHAGIAPFETSWVQFNGFSG